MHFPGGVFQAEFTDAGVHAIDRNIEQRGGLLLVPIRLFKGGDNQPTLDVLQRHAFVGDAQRQISKTGGLSDAASLNFPNADFRLAGARQKHGIDFLQRRQCAND